MYYTHLGMVYSLVGIFSRNLIIQGKTPSDAKLVLFPAQGILSFASQGYASVPTHKQMLEHSYFLYFKYTSVCL